MSLRGSSSSGLRRESKPSTFRLGRKEDPSGAVTGKGTVAGGTLISPPVRRNLPGKIAPFNNPLFDPEATSAATARSPSMSSAGDGGEKGGADEAPTHPKSFGGDAMVPARGSGGQIEPAEEFDHTSNWDERESVGLDGPEVSIGGEVNLDDDVVVEEEPA